jgi:aminoglycoside phosphotransferase (APT) family kinase protein
MTQSWTAEQVVTPELSRDLIGAQFPDLAGRPVEPLGVGWDNTAYLVDGRLVFRFPRRTIAVELIEVEARVLPRIAPRLPLPVPVPRWLGRPGQGYPWPFIGYEHLAGQVASDAGLTVAERERAAPLIGRFLATLHAIDPAGLDLPGDTIARADMTGRRDRTLERIDELAERRLIADAAPLRRLLAESPMRPPPAPPKPCHGDLYARHLLVDGGHRPCGVIDWGDVHAGHPAVDLAIAHGFLPPSARQGFLDAYGPVDDGWWAYARLRALFSCTVLLPYAQDVGDASLLSEAALGLDYVLG